MKQILVELQEGALKEQLSEIKQAYETGNYKHLLFHVYCGLPEEKRLTDIAKELKTEFPDAMIVGTLSAGEIRHGKLMRQGTLVSGMLFEMADVQVLRFDEIRGQEAQVGKQICEQLYQIPNLKGIELLLPGTEFNTRVLFEEIEKCPAGVQVFGGYAGGHALTCPEHFILDETGVLRDSVLVTTYAGRDFHINVDKSAGWQTLGMPFKITKADENRLIEIDGKPAVEVYEKYLQIDRNDSTFAEDTFEFPLMAKLNGEELLRHTMLVDEEGALLLAGYVTEDMDIYLCYGNPSSIVEKVNNRLIDVCAFQPEAILLYSCSVRRSFWEDFVDMEMIPFEKLAPTAGFHTWGEVRRDPSTDHLMEYNITLLSIAMREGDPKQESKPQVQVDDSVLKGQASLLQRLTKLVYATTEELQKAYESMTFLNEQLKVMAEHDALTGMYNRGKIEQLINETLDFSVHSKETVSLVMVDVDYFKHVNDTYGHDIGDAVLRELSAIMRDAAARVPGGQTGRWGGEEFFILLPNTVEADAYSFAERLRKQVDTHQFPGIDHLTISMGVISTLGIEDRKSIFTRVDDALYQAKDSGRNCIIQCK